MNNLKVGDVVRCRVSTGIAWIVGHDYAVMENEPGKLYVRSSMSSFFFGEGDDAMPWFELVYSGAAVEPAASVRPLSTTDDRDSYPRFELDHRDKNGYAPESGVLGTHWIHGGNGQEYVISGFVFLGELDEWGFLHERDGSGVAFVRSVSNFRGNRSDGAPRFVKVLD